jgi:gliding motility-associated lipoprotein GldD
MKTTLPIFKLLLGVIWLTACRQEAGTPRPYAYHRIDLPERAYQLLDSSLCPFGFEYPVAARIEKVQGAEHPCWMNIHYPTLNATIYLSYQPISEQVSLAALVQETQRLTYKHVVKASSIEEKIIYKTDKNQYGILYEVGGAAASATQFYITDSTQHFIRGSMYFYSKPAPDSLAPVIDYVLEDVRHLVESFHWKPLILGQ